jgi:adenine/guanine/hypoxanthine permease
LAGVTTFLTMADGLALGFITYPIIKALSQRGREVSWLMYLLAILLLLYFVFVRGRMD